MNPSLSAPPTHASSDVPFFTMDQVTAGYGHGNVLNNLSLTLEKGTLTALLGANGSGKTTLLKTICGYVPHKGACRLEGRMLEQMNARSLARRISYIPQRSGVSIPLPVLDVVLMGFHSVLGLLERPSRFQRETALNALAAAGLAGMESQDYLTLSEGQKQLCILARTLVEDTQLLLLDEPDSALDFSHRFQILRTLRTLTTDQAKAGLLCLHDPVLAFEFCDQILLMKDGRCTASLHPAQDSTDTMQRAFTEVFGPVYLTRLKDPHGRQRLAMLSDLCPDTDVR